MIFKITTSFGSVDGIHTTEGDGGTEMKRGTLDHPKFHALCTTLKLRRFEGAGLLECLWHFAALYARDGALSHFSPQHITDWIGWSGSPDELLHTLHKTGWIDLGPHKELLIHDWPDHCDDGVHCALARAGKRFANGTVPRLSRLGQRERAACEAVYANVTGKSAPDTSEVAEPRPSAEQIEALWQAYPKHIGQATAKNAIRAAFGDPELCEKAETRDPAKLFEALLARVQMYAEACKGRKPRFIKAATAWFAGRHYLDDPSEWAE